jgi:hypothetical protein
MIEFAYISPPRILRGGHDKVESAHRGSKQINRLSLIEQETRNQKHGEEEKGGVKFENARNIKHI